MVISVGSIGDSIVSHEFGSVQRERHSLDRCARYCADYRDSVVIPALNEADDVPDVLRRIPARVHAVGLAAEAATSHVSIRLVPSSEELLQENSGVSAR